MISALLLSAGVAVVVGGLGWLLVSQRRRTRDGWVECALRSPQQPLHGIGDKWRHGSARAGDGGLTFRPGGPGGARFPRGVPVEIPVVRASEPSGRRPALREAWSINPALHIAVVHTPDGELELAALPAGLSRLLSDLRTAGTDRSGG